MLRVFVTVILIGIALSNWVIIQEGALKYKPEQRVVGFIEFRVIPYMNKQFKWEWDFTLQVRLWF